MEVTTAVVERGVVKSVPVSMMWRKMPYQWRRAVVVMVVCGGLGLTLYEYCKISLRPYTDYRPVDPLHISHQDLGYAETKGHKSNNVREDGSVARHPQQNDESPLDDPSRKSMHGSESFIEQRSHSHSDNNEDYKSDHNKTINTADKSPPSVSATNIIRSWGEGKGRRQNQIFMTDVESNSMSKADENKKQNKSPPRVILLLTRWRSGSTFLGELLAKAVPRTFYSYEPLHFWGIRVLEEDDSSAQEAVVWLRDLFQCDMKPQAQQVNYLGSLRAYLHWNKQLRSQCSPPLKKQGTKQPSKKQQGKKSRQKRSVSGSKKAPGRQTEPQREQEPQPKATNHEKKDEVGERQLDRSKQRQQQQRSSSGGEGNNRPPCNDTSFVSDVCRHSALHVAKVVRLSLRRVVALLEDEDLPLQVVYLVRDPRAVLSSRSTRRWCATAACKDPRTVCSSVQQDLLLLPSLLHRFPNKLKMVFYEEFLQDLPDSLRDLLAFLHMTPAPVHRKYLKVSTQRFPAGQVSAHKYSPYSTSRNLTDQALMWRVKTPYEKATKYQEACKDVLTSLGLREFTSIVDYHNYSLPALLPRPRRPHS